MSNDHAMRDALHEATHRIPGVPEHRDRPAGHQGATHHGRSLQAASSVTLGAGPHQGSNPTHDRPPRVLVAWQNRIAGLFSRTTR